jgi:betaine-aldehyde dehydrogenase
MPVQQTMTMKYQDIHNYYDGHSQYSTSGKIFQTIDPSTSKPLATVHEASRSDIEAAIASARRAFPAWSRRPAVERCNILLRAAALLRKRNAELAEIETADTGKAFSETSTVDVISGAEVIEYFARLVGSGGLNGETTQLRDSAWVYSRKEPLGVCAGIGAWNYPLQIATVID